VLERALRIRRSRPDHGLYTESMTESRAPAREDWDATRYDRVSDPQVGWGRRVISRLAPRAGERVLDLGCGTGRLTAEIAAAVPGGFVLGLDRSETMLKVAAEALPAVAGYLPTGRLHLVRGDGAALPFADAFDAVFSAATLHWIADHDAVFRSVFSALRHGGRVVAQCGGGRNLERLYARAAALQCKAPYAPFFVGWEDPWHFAAPDPTREALGRAGFVDVTTSLEAAPVTFDDAATFSEFIGCVCVRHHLARLPGDLTTGFLHELTQAAGSDSPPLTLDYWRLNIDARRPSA
jgi:trans-aconitate 2-methyltransferase